MGEIVDFLRSVGHGWWFVVAAAVLAAVAVTASPPPPAYETRAVVSVDPTNDAANARIDFVRNLQAAAGLRSVHEELAAQVDRSAEEIADGLVVTRIADSQLTEVAWFDDEQDPVTGRAIVEAFPAAAAQLTAPGDDGRAAAAEDVLASAEQELADANQAATTFVRRRGGVTPDVELAALQDGITTARRDAALASAAGDDDEVAALEADAAALGERATALLEDVRRQQRVQEEQEAARSRVAEARRRVDDLAVTTSQTAAPPVVDVQREAREVGATAVVVQNAVSAGVVAGLLALLAVLAVRHRRGTWSWGEATGARPGHAGAPVVVRDPPVGADGHERDPGAVVLPPLPEAGDEHPALDARHTEVLALLAEGCTYDEVTARADIAREDIPVMVRRIQDALGTSDRVAAVAQAFRLGLLR